MAGQLCTNCHAPLDVGGAPAGGIVKCAYCKTDNRALGAGLAHAPGGLGPSPGAAPGFGAPQGGGPGFGAPPGGYGAPPPSPAFGAAPAFGTPPPAGYGAAPTPGVIGGPTGLPGQADANPKGWVAPPPQTVVPSTAGTNAELFGGIAGLLAWKSLVFVLGLIVPGFCCLSWFLLQLLVAGR